MKKMVISSIVFLMMFQFCYSKTSSLPLDGICLVLDAGHGGKDLGASVDGISEEAINLNIVLEMKKQLQKLGAKVTLTRSNHQSLANHQGWKSKDMKKRVEIMNEKQQDMMISIHLNSFMNANVKGSQIFYNIDELLANKVDQKLKKVTKSKLMVKKGDYYILNESKIPSLLIECGFLSNYEERMKLNNHKYQKKIASAIVDGIVEYFSMLA